MQLRFYIHGDEQFVGCIIYERPSASTKPVFECGVASQPQVNLVTQIYNQLCDALSFVIRNYRDKGKMVHSIVMTTNHLSFYNSFNTKSFSSDEKCLCSIKLLELMIPLENVCLVYWDKSLSTHSVFQKMQTRFEKTKLEPTE